jgi:hypothetical protein
MSEQNQQAHLANGVYASYNGSYILLRPTGLNSPEVICIEEVVLQALNKYALQFGMNPEPFKKE